MAVSAPGMAILYGGVICLHENMCLIPNMKGEKVRL